MYPDKLLTGISFDEMYSLIQSTDISIKYFTKWLNAYHAQVLKASMKIPKISCSIIIEDELL